MSHKGTERDSAEPDPESPEPSAGDESHQTHAPNNFIILSADPPQSGDGSLGLKDLHPLTRPLTIADLNSCVALENAAFEEHERCSREKFMYRLTKCGELSLGIFCTAIPDSGISPETLKTGRVVETNRKSGAVGALLAHIVSTMSNDSVVTDQSMDYPRDWNSPSPTRSNSGHQVLGRTICLHSLGVLPRYQGFGLGRTLLTAYIQEMASAGIADRIALIAHDHLIAYYEKFGFTRVGPSKAQFGGGGWIDMVFDLRSPELKLVYG